MSALFSGLGANRNPKIVWFWNEGQQKYRNTSPKFTNNLQKCINSRPDLSNVLSANVYADVEGRNRLIGTATFGIMELLSEMPLKKEVRRWTTPGRQNYLTISDYTTNGWPAAHMNHPIGNTTDKIMKTKKLEVHFPVLDQYNEHFKNNPKVAHKDFAYFKWPKFYFGPGYHTVGWGFTHLTPIGASSGEFFANSLNIAKARANFSKNMDDMTDEEKSIALAWTISAYSNSSPYSIEKDPNNPKYPAEYFSAMRLREFGDCEDVTWEAVANFRDLLSLPVGANTELGKLKSHAQNYSCLMTLVSATQPDATSKSNKETDNYMAHMVGVLMPNYYLEELGVKIGASASQHTKEVIPVFAEGTGMMWPNQHVSATFPSALTPRGLKFTNKMIHGTKSSPPTKGVRRYIFSPGSDETNHVVGEFYKHFLTAASHDPDVGLLEFRNANNELGALVTDVLNHNLGRVKVQKVPGTAMKDMNSKERLFHSAVIGLHEPIMPLYHDVNEKGPMSKIGPYVTKQFERAPPGATQDTVALLPFQEIGFAPEQNLIDFFERKKPKIAWIDMYKQPISGIGAIMFRIGLKTDK